MPALSEVIVNARLSDGQSVPEVPFKDTFPRSTRSSRDGLSPTTDYMASQEAALLVLESYKIKRDTPLAPQARELVVTSYWRTACTLADMGTSGTPEFRARRRAREQQRRQRLQHTPVEQLRPDQAGAAAEGPERRTAATTCGWCGGPITPRSRGPIPKWCSATCRHRAWEQRRAETSGRTAVQVVERRVEIRVPLEPTRRDWPRLLSELAGQLDDGRVYDRDLSGLGRALEPVLRSYRRRAHWSGAPDLP
jgi:hypothetical protein